MPIKTGVASLESSSGHCIEGARYRAKFLQSWENLRLCSRHSPERVRPVKVQDSRATQSMRVTTDGKNLTSRAGTALLSELADRSRLTEATSSAMAGCGINWHTQDGGVILTHFAVAVAEGADCLADMASLSEQSELFGPVASITTA